MGSIISWLNTPTEVARAQKLTKRQEKLDAQKARLNTQPSTSSTSSLPATVNLSQSFANPGITFTPSDAMRKQVLKLMGSKLTLMPVYVNGDGKIFTPKSFAELQQKSEFPLQAMLSARYVGTQPNAAGDAVILEEPIPPEEDIQAYLAALIAGGYKPLCATTANNPAQPAEPATQSDAPSAATPPVEQAPPNFTELAAKQLGYASDVSLDALDPDQLAALTKRANELKQEHKDEQAKQKTLDESLAKVTIATKRVVEQNNPELLANFLALVEAASLQTGDSDLDPFTDESRQLLQIMNPQTRTMLSAAATNPAFRGLLDMIEFKEPEEDDEPQEDGGNNNGVPTDQQQKKYKRRDGQKAKKQQSQQGQPPAAPAPAGPKPAPSNGGVGGSTT